MLIDISIEFLIINIISTISLLQSESKLTSRLRAILYSVSTPGLLLPLSIFASKDVLMTNSCANQACVFPRFLRRLEDYKDYFR